MPKNYNETISKIQASEELKKKIIENMKQENIKELNKGGTFVKIRKTLIAISTALALLIGSGAVYAAFGGTIFGRPALEYLGITFSDEYEEYVVPVENQSVENDKVKLSLVSTVCDDGFIVLNFNLKNSDSYIASQKAKYINKGWTEEEFAEMDMMEPIAISFNDKKYDDIDEWVGATSSYSTVIIDGKEFELRGRKEYDIQTVEAGKEYEIYVLYFLTDYELEGKDEFTLTLKNPIIKNLDEDFSIEEQYIELKGEFNIEVSKKKAMRNSDIVEAKNSEIKIGDFSDKLEKVVLTPLQNIIKITNTCSNRTAENAFSLANKDYIGEAEYKLFNSNDELIPIHSLWINIEYVHKDGTRTKVGPEESMDAPDLTNGDSVVYTTYIIFEKTDKNDNLTLNVYTYNEYLNTVKLMGTHSINLNKKEIKSNALNKQLDITTEQFGRFEDLYNHVTGTLMEIEEENYEDYEYEDDDIVEIPADTVVVKNETELEKEIGTKELYNNANDLYNDLLGLLFEIGEDYEKIKTPSGEELDVIEILNFDEVADKFLSKKGKEQFINSESSSIIFVNNKVYLVGAGRGSDVSYWQTELILDKATDDTREYTARSKYIEWYNLSDEELKNLCKNPENFEDQFTCKDEKFTIVKENGNWLVEDFTMPN
ncbi:MAG: DUF4179 domain-containing protein [Clostridia bacterium]|nr:DUF4179 domain-containing protein [Clostridia bacterium]